MRGSVSKKLFHDFMIDRDGFMAGEVARLWSLLNS